MNVVVHQTTWHGHPALLLESDAIQTVVIPVLGAKLVSLVDKRTGNEWLALVIARFSRCLMAQRLQNRT